ncbi:MAG: PrsW family intramembrane metalloprotease [Patescibacteria group bacterium]
MYFQGFEKFLLTLNPTNIILFFIFGALLCLFWLLFCLYLDRQAPEPKKQILKVFFWGGFTVFPILLITGPISSILDQVNWPSLAVQIFIFSFLIDGLFEELAKYAVLSDKVYHSKYFDEPRDGLIYGMIVGLGFSFVENFLYSLICTDLKEGLQLILLRGLLTTSMHFLSGGIIGYYFGLAKFRNKKQLILPGLIIAILFHGLYNTILRFGSDWTFIPLAILLVGTYTFIILGLRKIDKIFKKQPVQMV